MINYTPRKIMGRWKEGVAVDQHTLSSEFIGYDEFGHERFDTKRSEIGELLYKLKYNGDIKAVAPIVAAVEEIMLRWNPRIDIIVPVPPSNKRVMQPVFVLAEAINKKTGLPIVQCVKRTREEPQMKNVSDLDARLKLLDGLHTIEASVVQGKNILLFDDLYRSGATMNAITNELYEKGKAAEVYALTITKTKNS